MPIWQIQICETTIAALEGDMFQYKIDEISKELPYVFGVADDSLKVCYDGDSRMLK